MDNNQSDLQPQAYDPYEDEIHGLPQEVEIPHHTVCAVIAGIVSYNMTEITALKPSWRRVWEKWTATGKPLIVRRK